MDKRNYFFDPVTDLEWFVVRDIDTTWLKAEKLIKSLGNNNWRMPIVSELKGLYKKGLGIRNMSPELNNTGWFVWSAQMDSKLDDFAWGVYFDSGGGTSSRCSNSYRKRAFAVRYRK